MKKVLVVFTMVVLLFSLSALAADHAKTLVTAHPTKGGQPYKGGNPPVAPILTNLDTAYPLGVYYCCSGNLIAGPNNIDGFPPYSEALQFTLTSDTTIHSLKTAVNYDITGSTFTDFLFAIEADSGGVPSGTPLNKKPWTVTINSQSFGQCCAVESLGGKGLKLSAGTYWVVWTTESNSDIIAEVNIAIRDQVDFVNVAYSASNGAAGTWNPYQTNFPFAIQIR